MDTLNLRIPFTKKDWAKEQGCRWDTHNKTWYIPINKNKACLLEYIKDKTIIKRNLRKTWEYALMMNPWTQILDDYELEKQLTINLN